MPRNLLKALKDQRGTFPIYLSFFALAAFLLLIVFGPGIGERMGFLGRQKEQQESLAKNKTQQRTAQTASTLPASVDPDQDGFSTEIETYLGTDPNKACPTTTTANDEAVDAWPPDFNDDTFSDVSDQTMINPYFDKKVIPQTRRYDLNRDGFIDISDFSILGNYFGKSCPSPRGTISASPNPCQIPAGQNSCFLILTWSSTNATDPTVCIISANGTPTPEAVFLKGASGSTKDLPIEFSRTDKFREYIFTLYDAGCGSTRLASVTVTVVLL